MLDLVKSRARARQRLLGGVAGLFCCVWVLFWIADQVTRARTQRFDDEFMAWLREPGQPSHPVGPPWLPDVMRALTSLGSAPVLTLLVLAVAGALLARRQYDALVLLLVSTLGGAALIVLLKDVFERPRPGLALRLTHAGSTSFPSGHALASSVTYLTLAALVARLVRRRTLKLYLLGLAALLSLTVGATRVYLGVHYPSDVLAGWIAGLAWALLCWTVASYLQGSGLLEPTEPVKPACDGLRRRCLVGVLLLVAPRVGATAEAPHPTGHIRVLAVGDTGDRDGSAGVAEGLLARAQVGNSNALVFLGDNFYRRGLNRRDWENLLDQVMAPFRPTIARVGPENVHAISGNHDYYEYAFLGWEALPMGFFSLGNDRAALRRDLWRYHYWWTDDTILRSEDRAVGVQLVFVDSARALAVGPRYAADVFDRLREALERHRADPGVQWRIVVAHHPLETVGQHGNFGQAPGLMRRIRGWLIGGQDTHSSKYQEYRRLTLAAIKASGAKVQLFLAGHDHSLQLLDRAEGDCAACPEIHVVSGAGSEQTAVRASTGTDYTANLAGPPAEGGKGFVEVDAELSSLEVRFFGEGGTPHPVPMGPGGGVCEFTIGVLGGVVTTGACAH